MLNLATRESSEVLLPDSTPAGFQAFLGAVYSSECVARVHPIPCCYMFVAEDNPVVDDERASWAKRRSEQRKRDASYACRRCADSR